MKIDLAEQILVKQPD